MKNLLCADIGGTNSRFAHFVLTEADDGEGGKGGGELQLRSVQWLPTESAASLAKQLTTLYAGDFTLPPDQTDLVVLAVAGPVREGRYSKLPLAGWEVDLPELIHRFGFTAGRLINDFKAQALAILAPPGAAAQEILPGQAAAHGAIAVIGAGTGLGKALLQINPDGRGAAPLVIPSEGGHADFPFAGGEEAGYLEFLRRKRQEERINGNSVVSGQGLSALHQFLSGEELAPAAVSANFAAHPRTLEWAARFYGRVCRNYVLETLATGGLYIAGGIAAKAPELLRHPAFAREFHLSPSMAELLGRVPVKLINDENSGLWGAATLARYCFVQPHRPASGNGDSIMDAR